MVWYYTIHINGNADDLSGNGNNGVVNGVISIEDRFGTSEKAFSFNFPAWVDCGNILDEVFTTNTYSISIWYKRNNDDPPGTTINKWYSCCDEPIDNAFYMGTFGFCSKPPANICTSTPYAEIDNWTHDVAVLDNGTLSYYRNGELIATDLGHESQTSDKPLMIGATYTPLSSPQYQFHGTMDDIRIYNRALSESEIQALFNEGGWGDKTPHLIEAMARSFEKVLEGSTLTKKNLDSYTHMATEYSNNIKHFAYFNAGLFKVIELAVYFDLDDYVGITEEGKQGWVTTWINGGFNIGLGLLPIEFGLAKTPFQPLEPDPQRKVEWTGPSISAGFKIESFNVSNGLIEPPSASGVALNISASLSTVSWNLFRFEMKKELINQIMMGTFPPLFIGQLVSIYKEELQKSYFEFDDVNGEQSLKRSSWENSFRNFTSLDDGNPQEISGNIEFALGGFDINQDGYPDNYYITTPNLPGMLEIHIFTPMYLKWLATGNNTADYYVKVYDVPDNWRVWAYQTDNWIPHIIEKAYNSWNVLPGQNISTKWAIQANEFGADEIKIKFILHKNNLLGSDPGLDTLFVTLHKYKGQVLSFNGMCPISLRITTPSGEALDSTAHAINVFYNKWDFDDNGDMDVQVMFASADPGEYKVEVIPNSTASPNDYYSLIVNENWQTTTLADSVLIQNISPTPYNYVTTTTDYKNETIKIYGFQIDQNYPNPFNPTTTIRYTLPKETAVQLSVHDMLGREVKTISNEFKPAGEYEVEFDASSLSSGIYYYRLQAGDYVETRKMILLK